MFRLKRTDQFAIDEKFQNNQISKNQISKHPGKSRFKASNSYALCLQLNKIALAEEPCSANSWWMKNAQTIRLLLKTIKMNTDPNTGQNNQNILQIHQKQENSTKNKLLVILRVANLTEVVTSIFKRSSELMEVFGKNGWCIGMPCLVSLTELCCLSMSLCTDVVTWLDLEFANLIRPEFYGSIFKSYCYFYWLRLKSDDVSENGGYVSAANILDQTLGKLKTFTGLVIDLPMQYSEFI